MAALAARPWATVMTRQRLLSRGSGHFKSVRIARRYVGVTASAVDDDGDGGATLLKVRDDLRCQASQ